MCGHDFHVKFRDVCAEVVRLSNELNRSIQKVRSLWYLLPEQNVYTKHDFYKQIRSQLSSLYPQENKPSEIELTTEDYISSRERAVNDIKKFKYKIVISTPKHRYSIAHGDDIVCSGVIKNKSGNNWPIVIDGIPCLRIGAELYTKHNKRKVSAARADLSNTVFHTGEKRIFTISVPTKEAPSGPSEVMVDLVYEYITWFGKRGAKPVRITINIK